jgi:hypothetical protein
MIKLDDTYSIKADKVCYVLISTRISQGEKTNGQEVEVAESYHGTIEKALLAYAKRVVHDGVESGTLDTLNKVVSKIDDLKRFIQEKLEIK